VHSPMPPQTPAQKASTSLPLFSRSWGWTLSSGTRRTHLSWRVGLRLGLYLVKKGEEKIGSVVSMGSKTSLRVAPMKIPTVAAVPAADTLRKRLIKPIVSDSGVAREGEEERRGEGSEKKGLTGGMETSGTGLRVPSAKGPFGRSTAPAGQF